MCVCVCVCECVLPLYTVEGSPLKGCSSKTAISSHPLEPTASLRYHKITPSNPPASKKVCTHTHTALQDSSSLCYNIAE